MNSNGTSKFIYLFILFFIFFFLLFIDDFAFCRRFAFIDDFAFCRTVFVGRWVANGSDVLVVQPGYQNLIILIANKYQTFLDNRNHSFCISLRFLFKLKKEVIFFYTCGYGYCSLYSDLI